MSAAMDVLREAIERKKPVSFRYLNPKKPDEPKGRRVGNPHAIYATAPGNINLDLYQTGGVALPVGVDFPVWRDYALKYIADATLLEDKPPFELATDYKPYNKKYERKFIKL
jgi:hypothetical protein